MFGNRQQPIFELAPFVHQQPALSAEGKYARLIREFYPLPFAGAVGLDLTDSGLNAFGGELLADFFRVQSLIFHDALLRYCVENPVEL